MSGLSRSLSLLLTNSAVLCDLSHVSEEQFLACQNDLLQVYGGPLTQPWKVDWLGNIETSLAPIIPAIFRQEYVLKLSGNQDSQNPPAGPPKATESKKSEEAYTPQFFRELIESAAARHSPASNEYPLEKLNETLPLNDPECLLIYVQELIRYVLLNRPLAIEEAAQHFEDFLVGGYGSLTDQLGRFPDKSLRCIEWIVENFSPEAYPLDCFAHLFQEIPSEVFSEYAAPRGSSDLRRLAAYYTASLPWVEIFWREYLIQTEPEAYTAAFQKEVLPWRRGKAPTDVDEDVALRWMYAGLDYPRDLTFESFCIEMEQAPEIAAPFLNRSFTTTARLKGGSGREVTVEFRPAHSRADYFYGHVSEEWGATPYHDLVSLEQLLQSEDFQLYRMVSEGRLVGMVYLERRPGSSLLLMQVCPRNTWAVDLDSLLTGLERSLIPISEKEGYSEILISDAYYEDSFYQRSTDAIHNAVIARYPTEEREDFLLLGEYFSGFMRVFWSKPS